ncbi:MAG: sugar ABC transporter substrate-binding protein [Phycisphaerae bacterium]|nr:sugar ABC transporter substrate-binding protein [Phycisphaerae bacterium]
MSVVRAVRALILVAVGGAVGYWLFADTVGRYRVSSRPANEIRFSYWGGFDDHLMWRSIIEAFEVHHPDLRVKPEWLPLSGYSTKMDQQFVAGDAPDVIMFQDEPFARYAAEQFADLAPFLRDDPETRRRLADCWPTAVSSFQQGGSLRGVPVMGGNVLIYCNLDAFERASRFHGERITPPSGGWTLDEFVATCLRLTIDEDGDGDVDQFAFMQPHWVYYLPFIWSHGARLLDEGREGGSRFGPDGVTLLEEGRPRWALVGPEAVAAFAFYADLRHRWGVTPMPIEYAGQNSDTTFLSGRVAMCVNGPWFQAFLRETALRDRYCVVGIPSGPGGSWTRVTWDALCIYAKLPPPRQARAWRFIRFVLTAEAQEIFAAHQRAIPARRACAEAYVRDGGGPGSPAAAFVEAMKTARLQPITPAWMTMARAVRTHLTSVILDGAGRRSPEEAVAALASDPGIVETFGNTD